MKKEDIFQKIKELRIPELENNPELLQQVLSQLEIYSQEKAAEDIDMFQELASDRIANLGEIPIPLTKGESLLFEERFKKVIEQAKESKRKISETDELIKEMIDINDTDLNVDISESSSLRKAMRKVFKKRTNSITYEDYKELLKLRKEISKQEKKDFRGK